MSEPMLAMVVAMAACLVVIVGMLILVARLFQRAPPGSALVITSAGGTRVVKGGAVVYPMVMSSELIDLKEKVLRLERRGRDALSTRDDVRFDIDVCVTIRIDDASESILHVASTLGCSVANDVAELQRRFLPTVADVVAQVIASVTSVELLEKRDQLVDRLQKQLGDALGKGFRLERAAVERLERTTAEGAGPFR